MGLGKGSECLNMAQSLTCVHMGLQASNGNSESGAEKMFRVSPRVRCAQMLATHRI